MGWVGGARREGVGRKRKREGGRREGRGTGRWTRKGGGGSRGEGGEKRSDKGSDMTLYRTAPRLPLCRRRRYLATLTSPRHTTPPAVDSLRRRRAGLRRCPSSPHSIVAFGDTLHRCPWPVAGRGRGVVGASSIKHEDRFTRVRRETPPLARPAGVSFLALCEQCG